MNVIAGKLKGKKLVTLAGINTRPTLTRIKKNIFNILNNNIDFNNIIVADFFGGSGSLAIEALSRGAKFAFINDINVQACKVIKTNVKNCNFEDKTTLYNFDYKQFSKKISQKLNLIFIDPPFMNHTCQKWIINYCESNQLLSKNAIIVLETNIEINNLALNYNFKVLSDKKYSKIYIKIIQYAEENSN